MFFRRAGGQALIAMLLAAAVAVMIASRLPTLAIFIALLMVLLVLVGITVWQGRFVGPGAYIRSIADDASKRVTELKARIAADDNSHHPKG